MVEIPPNYPTFSFRDFNKSMKIQKLILDIICVNLLKKS